MGLAASADAQLAEPVAGLSLHRQRPRRLPDAAGGRRLHRGLRKGDLGAGANPHHRHLGAQRRRRLPRAHGPRRLALPDRRHRLGCVQHRAPAKLCRPCAAIGRDADGAVVSQSGAGRRWRRARRRRFVERHPDRARAAARGARGHDRGRRAHPRAAHVSRQGSGMVDGCGRRARRALRPGRRHRAGAPRALAAACRHTRPLDPRPQRALATPA